MFESAAVVRTGTQGVSGGLNAEKGGTNEVVIVFEDVRACSRASWRVAPTAGGRFRAHAQARRLATQCATCTLSLLYATFNVNTQHQCGLGARWHVRRARRLFARPTSAQVRDFQHSHISELN